MFNAAIKAIIDLLKLRKDVQKTDLEINKLEREEEQAQSRIHRVSFEDIEKYDPQTRQRLRLARSIEREKRYSKSSTSLLAILITLLALLLVPLLIVLTIRVLR